MGLQLIGAAMVRGRSPPGGSCVRGRHGRRGLARRAAAGPRRAGGPADRDARRTRGSRRLIAGEGTDGTPWRNDGPRRPRARRRPGRVRDAPAIAAHPARDGRPARRPAAPARPRGHEAGPDRSGRDPRVGRRWQGLSPRDPVRQRRRRRHVPRPRRDFTCPRSRRRPGRLLPVRRRLRGGAPPGGRDARPAAAARRATPASRSRRSGTSAATRGPAPRGSSARTARARCGCSSASTCSRPDGGPPGIVDVATVEVDRRSALRLVSRRRCRTRVQGAHADRCRRCRATAARRHVGSVHPRLVLDVGHRPRRAATTAAGRRPDRDPTMADTRGITIDAPPEAVWPWLLQMGYGRGGWYSYDRLDMKGSADEILPEHQALAVGDIVPTDPRAASRSRSSNPAAARPVRGHGAGDARRATARCGPGSARSTPAGLAASGRFIETAVPPDFARLLDVPSSGRSGRRHAAHRAGRAVRRRRGAARRCSRRSSASACSS